MSVEPWRVWHSAIQLIRPKVVRRLRRMRAAINRSGDDLETLRVKPVIRFECPKNPTPLAGCAIDARAASKLRAARLSIGPTLFSGMPTVRLISWYVLPSR